MKDLNKENSIRELFLSFVYVGCIGLNYIFVQQNNKLFMVNLLSFIKGYIMNFIKLKPLLVKYIKEEFYNVKEILSIFLDENP